MTAHWYWGDQEVMETDSSFAGGSGGVLRRYVRLPGSVDEAFLMVDYGAGCGASGCRRYAHHDRLGSAVAVTDETAQVLETYAYAPYGGSLGDDTGFPFRFTGQRLDPETGLYYDKARYYDPEDGRFLQTDPIGYEDQMNLYAYVHNDPVNGTDPTGMCVASRINTADGSICRNSADEFTAVASISLSSGAAASSSAHPRQGEAEVRPLDGSYFSAGAQTEEEAAQSAMAQLVAMMNGEPVRVEFGALLLKRGRNYGYSDAATSFERNRVGSNAIQALRSSMGTWWQLYAGNTIHTHPTNPRRGQRYIPQPGTRGDSPGDWIAGPNGCLFKLTPSKYFSGEC